MNLYSVFVAGERGLIAQRLVTTLFGRHDAIHIECLTEMSAVAARAVERYGGPIRNDCCQGQAIMVVILYRAASYVTCKYKRYTVVCTMYFGMNLGMCQEIESSQVRCRTTGYKSTLRTIHASGLG